MSKSKSNYRWYIEPLNHHSSETIADFIGKRGETPEEVLIRASDGKDHSVYEVPHLVVERAQSSKQQSRLRFKVYVQEGDGVPRLWRFGGNKKSFKTIRAEEELKKMTA